MDNAEMPMVQQPAQATAQTPSQMPAMQQQVNVMPKKDVGGIVKTVAIIVLSLVAVTFIGLFIWMTLQYNEEKTDVDGKIAVAVAEAKDEQATKLEAEFAEREKEPYRTFSGPVDYGQLTFEYPKTWSVYIEKAATNGGDFSAYLNPVQVDTIGKETINALRFEIRDKSFEDVAKEYQKVMDKKDSGLSMVVTNIGKDNKIAANRYTGKIPETQLNGYIVIFKIRDKTAVLRTDSVLFEADYNKILSTLTFNE